MLPLTAAMAGSSVCLGAAQAHHADLWRHARAILDDPEASANDRFVALEFVKNANIAAGGVAGADGATRRAVGPPPRAVDLPRSFSSPLPLNPRRGNSPPPPKAGLDPAMKGHVIGHAELVGTYQHKR